MRPRNYGIISIISILIITGCFIWVISVNNSKSTTTKTVHQFTSRSSSSNTSCPTRNNGQLPDPSCTPGKIDPNVTQENIHTTICIPGYSKSVRPPANVTSPWKKNDKLREGYPTSAIGEEDHLISIELGGAPSNRRNLWFESGKIPNPKDSVENLLHREVCDGKISLAEAQREISSNWTAVK